MILAAAVLICIPLQFVRSGKPHPALIAAILCIGMLTSLYSSLLCVVLLALSAVIILIGVSDEDSMMWLVYWVRLVFFLPTLSDRDLHSQYQY